MPLFKRLASFIKRPFKKKHYILSTQVLSYEQGWTELHALVNYLQENGLTQIQYQIGFQWALVLEDNSKDKHVWNVKSIEAAQLPEMIKSLEKKTGGQLLKDDLWIIIGNVSVQFCNDSHIHIESPIVNEPLTQYMNLRWKQLSYELHQSEQLV